MDNRLATQNYIQQSESSASLRLSNQVINASVTIGQAVYYDSTNSEWIMANNLPTIGIYEGNNIIILKGICNLSGLTPGLYYVTSTGNLTSDYTQAYKQTKIGVALSSTKLLVNICVEGSYTTV